MILEVILILMSVAPDKIIKCCSLNDVVLGKSTWEYKRDDGISSKIHCANKYWNYQLGFLRQEFPDKNHRRKTKYGFNFREYSFVFRILLLSFF